MKCDVIRDMYLYVICGKHGENMALAIPFAIFQGSLVVWLERVQLFPTISRRRKMFWCWWRPMQPRQSALEFDALRWTTLD